LNARKAVAGALRAGLAIAALLAPLSAMLVLGAGSAPLWLDEITYFRLQSDFALRASEIGRSGSAFAPFFSNFFYCDVQRAFQALLGALGIVRFESSPEWLLRALSVISFAASGVFIALRASRGRALTGLAGGLLFGAAPMFLYYAFEARVYAFVAFFAILLFDRIEAAALRPGPWAWATVALLGAFVAHLHLWTICLFSALFARAALEVLRRRRATPLVRALLAASAPALALIALEYGFVKATQRPDPLFALFARQPLGATLAQTGLSIFEGPLQVQFVFQQPLARAFVAGCLVLLGLLVGGALRETEPEGTFGTRSAAGVALGALAISVALAVGFGYFVHGRYQVPLFAVLIWAVARGLSSRRSLLLALLLVAGEAVLLPSSAAAIRAKSNNAEIASTILKGGGRAEAAVIVQHGVASGYPAPHHTIGLDFYLNDVHPDREPIPIFELPDLRSTQGDHGTYRYFNGGPPLLARTLEIHRDRYEAWTERARFRDLWVIEPLWDVAPSREQVRVLLEALTARRHFVEVTRLYAPGYPRSLLIQLRRGDGGAPEAP
jgi:hypothetical protein